MHLPEQMESARATGKALKALRQEAGLTQYELAQLLEDPQSYISKLESGERALHVADLDSLASALEVNVTTILNRIAGLDSVLDRWEFSETELTELIDTNPSLRGMVLGYAAEMKFRRLYLRGRDDITSTKDDDHDRKKKGDRRLFYKGREVVVEVKSLQTNTCEYDPESDTWSGRTQVDASDRREVTFDDDSTLNTTLLLRGEFDILAVNCFAFGDTWRFQFALNEDLKTSKHRKYTQEQRQNLIASLQTVAWPPEKPFTDSFDEILERAWERSQRVQPDVKEIRD